MNRNIFSFGHSSFVGGRRRLFLTRYLLLISFAFLLLSLSIINVANEKIEIKEARESINIELSDEVIIRNEAGEIIKQLDLSEVENGVSIEDI